MPPPAAKTPQEPDQLATTKKPFVVAQGLPRLALDNPAKPPRVADNSSAPSHEFAAQMDIDQRPEPIPAEPDPILVSEPESEPSYHPRVFARSAAATGADAAAAAQLAAPVPPHRRFRARRALAIGLAGALCFGAGMVGERAVAPPGLPSSIDGFNLGLFAQTLSVLDNHYVDTANLDQGKLQAAALSALVAAVGDTGHTDYLTAAQAAALDSSLSGSFVGIGIEIGVKDGYPLVGRIFVGSPAQAAGLKVGDEIISADGFDLHGASIDLVTSRIRGAAGSIVELMVKSPDGTTRQVTCTRAKVEVPAVDWAMVPGTSVADVRIEQFASGEGDALIAALGEVKTANASAIILDLRDNPGGYVSEAMATASQFLQDGNVYLSQDAAGVTTKHPVNAGGLDPTIPLVVLVNAGSASASEIVAGALQDAGRAKIIGSTTFGTGTVLARFPLSDGSVVMVGVERWLTPAGHVIWHTGIAPDLPVNAGPNPYLAPSQLAGSGADWQADPVLADALAQLLGQPLPVPTASPAPSPSPSPVG